MIPWVILVCAISLLRGTERWVVVSRGVFMAPYVAVEHCWPQTAELALHKPELEVLKSS